MVSKNVSKRVLTISVDLNNRGGIASVVRVLSKHYDVFYFLPSSTSGNMFLKLYLLLKTLVGIIYYRLFKKVRIVHIHTASYKSFVRKSVFIILSKIAGLKVVLHIHGGNFKIFYESYNKLSIIHAILSKADSILVLSHSWFLFFSGELGFDKVDIINNIIEKPLNVPIEKGRVCSKPTHYLFLGEIREMKGIFDLVEAIIEIKDLLKDRFILHVGGDGEVDRLNQLIKENGIEDLISLEGWVNNDGKTKLLELCDVYVLPSYFEGMPISILESMSYKMPIIGTNVGGVPEILKDGVNGFLFDPGDKQSLKESLLYFVDNPAKIVEMGKRSEELVKPFYPEAVIPKLQSIYETLLEEK